MENELKGRTLRFALSMIRFVEAVTEKEVAETEYWLILCAESGLRARSEEVLSEARELLAILTAIGRTAKQRRP